MPDECKYKTMRNRFDNTSQFNTDIFKQLSYEDQVRVECIYKIAAVLSMYDMEPLTAEEFDTLYDKSVGELCSMANHVSIMDEAQLIEQWFG